MPTKLLGEGSFGCVFQPAMPCIDKERPINKLSSKQKKDRVVGKLFVETDDFRTELVASKRAARTDPEGHTMLVPSATCKTTRKAVDKVRAAKKCEALESSTDKTLHQILMPFGGQRLDHYFRNMYERGHPVHVATFLEMIKPAFEGLVLLEKKQMCHQDIKSSNMLMTPENQAILIDFSLMIPFKEVYDKNNYRRHRYSYYPYPPEYKLAVPHRKLSLIDDVMKNIYQFGKERGDQYLKFIPQSTIRQRVRALETSFKPDPLTLLQPYANRVDMYGLGVSIVDVSRYLNVPSAWREKWKRFIRHIVDPDPQRRASPQEALEHLTALMTKNKH